MVAHKLPSITREARYWISEHAVHRLRERGEPELNSMTDRDLAQLLDERIFAAFGANRVEDVVDSEAPDETTKVAAIDRRDGRRLFVVLRMHRPNGYPPLRTVVGPAGVALAAITVLTQEMATANYSSKRWAALNRATPPTLEHRPFANLRVAPSSPTPRPSPYPPSHHTPSPRASAPGEPTRKFTLGATRAERAEFAMNRIRENLTISQADLSKAIEDKFGTPMSYGLMNELRERVAEEVRTQAQAQLPPSLAAMNATLDRMTERVKAPAPAPPAPAPAASASVNIAMQYAQAIESERLAKARKADAERELAAAQAVLDAASAQVDLLMEQMQKQRSA